MRNMLQVQIQNGKIDVLEAARLAEKPLHIASLLSMFHARTFQLAFTSGRCTVHIYVSGFRWNDQEPIFPFKINMRPA